VKPVAAAALQRLQRPIGWGLVALMAAAYLGLALAPFRWVPPRRTVNGATADAGGLGFAAPGLASTPEPPAWLSRAAETGTLRLDLRLRAYASDEGETGRIFTVSRDYHSRNVTLDEEGTDLVLRLRRPGATPNGKPAYRLPAVLTDTDWHDVQVTIAPGQLRVTIDGRVVLTEPLAERPLRDWDLGHRVALGNEHHGHLPWRGEVARAVVEVGSTTIDYASPNAVEVRTHFWQFGNRPTWFLEDYVYPHSVEDWLANFIAFVPLGFLLTALGRRPRAWRRAIWLCAIGSLLVEIAQGFFARHPATMDWAFNTLGAAVGAAVAVRLAESRHRGASTSAAVAATKSGPSVTR
jgi:hypothetical protein